MKSNLVKRGFTSLLATQFFGAANDNILKGVLTYMVIAQGTWDGQLGEGGQAIVGVIFTLPFIILSGYAGQVADRFSKSSVSFAVKVTEIPIAMVAGIGFWTGNLWVTLTALLALTCQSAFFGPAKYGMIPELVRDEELSRANGTINMMTNIAVIVGTLTAGYVADLYNPLPESEIPQGAYLYLPFAVLVAVAIAGLVSVVFLDRLSPGDRDLKWDLHPLRTYIDSIRDMAKTRLLMVMMAWGYFYLLAGIALFILPEYTTVLDISRVDASILMGILGVSVGVGCAVAGLVSGRHIEPRLIPLGAIGLVFFFALLGFVEPKLYGVPADSEALAGVPNNPETILQVALSNVALFIAGAGFSAGFYIVPLQALLQKLSPDDERGRFLGTANAVSFAFMTVAAGVFYAVREPFGDAPQRIFLLCSALMLAGTIFFLWRLRGSGVMSGEARP